jgi:transposase
MPKQIDFTLTDAQVTALIQAIKQDKRPRVVRRATAVHLLHQGYPVAEVATIVSASKPILYAWHKRFLAQGVEGLANQTKQVGRRKVSAGYMAALTEALRHEPAHYGYPFAIWTRERLRDHLADKTGIHLSINWVGELLKAHGYGLRRPKHDLSHRQDPVAKAAAQETLEALKKTPRPTISGFSLWTKAR